MPKSGTWTTPRSGCLSRREEKKGRRGRREEGGRESEGRVDNKRMQGRVKGGGMERRGSRVMVGKQDSEGEGTKTDSDGCKVERGVAS